MEMQVPEFAQVFMPMRNSARKCSPLLGNFISKSLMVAAVSPAGEHVCKSLKTLSFSHSPAGSPLGRFLQTAVSARNCSGLFFLRQGKCRKCLNLLRVFWANPGFATLVLSQQIAANLARGPSGCPMRATRTDIHPAEVPQPKPEFYPLNSLSGRSPVGAEGAGICSRYAYTL